MLVHLMLQPVRTIAARGPAEDVPYTVRASARSHVCVIIAPSRETGPTAVHVPLTGHNLLFEVRADGGQEVLVERVTLGPISRSALEADAISIIQNQFMPPFSADFVDAVQRSVSAYEPLKYPDLEIDLDSGSIRRLDEDSPALPLRVPAHGTKTLVLAPVTDARDLVNWIMTAEISCAGRTEEFTWDMTVTAQTYMQAVAGPEKGLWAPVHRFFPDHWHRASSKQAVISAVLPGHIPTPAAHTSSDGSHYLRRPGLESEPEPKKAAKLRARGNRHGRRGRLVRARAAYAAAAEAGSSEAAYWLGYLLDASGDLDGALRWYRQAAEQRFFPAFNDLAVLHFRRGELDQAEHWFRRGMDAGDWTAAAGLGALLRHRGDAEAESLLRIVEGTSAGKGAAAVMGDDLARADLEASVSSADQLAGLLHEQGRVDEARAMWEAAAADGSAHAAFSLGELSLSRGDRGGAKRWWRQSAEAGSLLGAYHLGELFQEDADTAEAERWWRTAADSLERTLAQGASTAETGSGRQIMIGALHQSGEVRAAYKLGMSLLIRGRAAEAEHWLTLAARGGHRGARYELAGKSESVQEPIHDGGADPHSVEPMESAIRQGDWLVLPKPGWKRDSPSEVLPVHAMVGGWALDGDGIPGPFEPNPVYVPDDRSTPTDPVHALLRFIAAGHDGAIADRLLSTLRNSVVEIACDEQAHPLVGLSPDGVRCVAVVTAEIHKRLVPGARWIRVVGDRLPEAVPVDTDIMLNPGDDAQFRLLTQAI
ncbi:type VII secretion system-associated protein [Kitasatospora phosalacinea]|uniref:type VII secretion system-associated protein n=1 Tax=Kitasatospora phosalacinea TaxID=2065 RepID=UPI000525AB93|nr:type VII secretion system-associated protein [Kitasatospora phosalacinea]